VKKLKILFFLFLFSGKLFSQPPFAPPGAVWYYDMIFMSYGGFIKIEAKYDTTIQGITCRKLDLNLYKWYTIGPGQVGFDLSPLAPKFVYQSGDTVFWLTGNQFQVLYNFNASQGSQWTVTDSMGWSSGGCDSLSIVEVDSTGNESINAENLRYLAVHPEAGSPLGFYGRIYERLGSMNILFPEYAYCDTDIIVDAPFYRLHCYQDSLFPLYKTDTLDCEWWWVLQSGNLIHDEKSLFIFPNPSADFAEVTAASSLLSLTIVNAMGQLVWRHEGIGKSNSIRIDTRNFSPGLYFIFAETGSGMLSRKFIKI
jgi:hypothetical protein